MKKVQKNLHQKIAVINANYNWAVSHMSDTIYALSTPMGRSGIAVIRVTGQQALEGYKILAKENNLPTPRHAITKRLYSPTTGHMIDHALVLTFQGPNSFTAENMVEYHVHGGQAIIQALLAALSICPHHRMAEPGEFTRRAFENGKMDLTQAEAIADLIHAETEAQRLQALEQMEGALYHLYEGWKDRLAKLLALMEADLDFSDQDLPEDIIFKVSPDISDILTEIKNHLDDGRRGELLRDGFRLVIIGEPNVGKSTLLNQLTKRDVAIVSPIAGTTRDVIETHINLGGYPVILMDTAGLRGTEDSIEQEGIARALKKADEADIVLQVLDADGLRRNQPLRNTQLESFSEKIILVVNKADTITDTEQEIISQSLPTPAIFMAAHTGHNIDKLLEGIVSRIAGLITPRSTPSLTRTRHREALSRAYDCLLRSQQAPLPELVAEDLRLAVRALGSLTGRVDVEDLLDMIFRDFCIGK